MNTPKITKLSDPVDRLIRAAREASGYLDLGMKKDKLCGCCGKKVAQGLPSKVKRFDGFYWHTKCWVKFLSTKNKRSQNE